VSNDYRYELKFVLDETGFSKAKSWLYTCTTMRRAFPARIVNSIYFDDPGYSSVRDNLAGIMEREKVRLRWYQLDGDSQKIFPPSLEIKLRNGRLGRKNKLVISGLEDNLLNLEYKDLFPLVSSKLGSVKYFDSHYSPTLHVRYLREYFEDFRGVRITFDRQISFMNPLPHSLVAQNIPAFYSPTIMEVKFPLEHKIYVTSLLRMYNKSAVRHSKYLVGLATFGYVNYI
jgi:hypothetical protein